MTLAARRDAAGEKRVRLLAHSAGLRTALRRAFAATPYSLVAEGPALAGVSRADVLVVDFDAAAGGFGLIERFAAADPGVPVIAVVAGAASGDPRRAEVLQRGAAAAVSRPDSDEPQALRSAADEIVRAIGAAQGRAPLGVRGKPACTPPQVLVVGSSTGGPQALMKLFSQLSPSAVKVPVLVVQHMPPAFTPILAEHISRATTWRAAEAKADEALVPGEVRVAPGGFHLEIAGNAAARRLRLTDRAPVNFCRPSADVLFFSAVEQFGRAVLAVILTGMGSDGCEGAKAIHAAGGVVLAQDRASSVVWGMPGAAVNAGVVDRVAALDALGPIVTAAVAGTLV